MRRFNWCLICICNFSVPDNQFFINIYFDNLFFYFSILRTNAFLCFASDVCLIIYFSIHRLRLSSFRWHNPNFKIWEQERKYCCETSFVWWLLQLPNAKRIFSNFFTNKLTSAYLNLWYKPRFNGLARINCITKFAFLIILLMLFTVQIVCVMIFCQ